MNGSLKKSARTLYGVCSCIIVLMVICYFGVSNSKGTYSATICYACTNGGSTFYSTSNIPGVSCTQTDNSKCQSSSSSSSSSQTVSSCSSLFQGNCGDKFVRNTTKTYTCKKDNTTYTYDSDEVNKCRNSSGELVSYYDHALLTAITPTVSCSSVEKGSCGSDEIISTSSSMTSCVKGNIKYFYTKTNYGTCEYTEDEGQKHTVYKYTKTGSTQVSCTRQYVNCNYDAQKEDCSDLGGTLNGTTCNIYSSGCTSDTFNCDSNVATTSNCYICLGTSGSVSTGGEYKPSNSSPGSNCHLTSSTTCSGTPVAKKYECTLTDKSKVCVTAYDSAWASADVGETGTSCKEVTSCTSTPGGGETPIPSSSSSSSSSSKPSSSKPSSSSSLTAPGSPTPSSNVDDNPKTGSVAIFMVWVIALGTLIYSFVYFKQSKFE